MYSSYNSYNPYNSYNNPYNSYNSYGNTPPYPGESYVGSPLREDKVKSAVVFLRDPKVVSFDSQKKIVFLEDKGLSSNEIAEAFRRVAPSSKETELVVEAAKTGRRLSEAVASGPSTSSPSPSERPGSYTPVAATGTSPYGAPPFYNSYGMPTVSPPPPPGMLQIGPNIYSYPYGPLLPPEPPAPMPAPPPPPPPPPPFLSGWKAVVVGASLTIGALAAVGAAVKKYAPSLLSTLGFASPSTPTPSEHERDQKHSLDYPYPRTSPYSSTEPALRPFTQTHVDSNSDIYGLSALAEESKEESAGLHAIREEVNEMKQLFADQSKEIKRALQQIVKAIPKKQQPAKKKRQPKPAEVQTRDPLKAQPFTPGPFSPTEPSTALRLSSPPLDDEGDPLEKGKKELNAALSEMQTSKDTFKPAVKYALMHLKEARREDAKGIYVKSQDYQSRIKASPGAENFLLHVLEQDGPYLKFKSEGPTYKSALLQYAISLLEPYST